MKIYEVFTKISSEIIEIEGKRNLLFNYLLIGE